MICACAHEEAHNQFSTRMADNLQKKDALVQEKEEALHTVQLEIQALRLQLENDKVSLSEMHTQDIDALKRSQIESEQALLAQHQIQLEDLSKASDQRVASMADSLKDKEGQISTLRQQMATLAATQYWSCCRRATMLSLLTTCATQTSSAFAGCSSLPAAMRCL